MEATLHFSFFKGFSYLWFCQKRLDGVPISGTILCEKAKQLHCMFNCNGPFLASEGWKRHFCKRYGIRSLSMAGEKLSANRPAAETFISTFSQFVIDNILCLDQIFNCDETCFEFRLLPDKTLAAAFEKSADGRKESKNRVTLGHAMTFLLLAE